MLGPTTASSMPRPWLSVILPVYRGEEWLDRTLGSVAHDPDTGIEVVIIDSSPTPDTIDRKSVV